MFAQTGLGSQDLQFVGVNLLVNAALHLDLVAVNLMVDCAVKVFGEVKILDHLIFQSAAFSHGSGLKFLGVKPALVK